MNKKLISLLTVMFMALMFFTDIPINVSAETISGTGYSFDTATGVMTITENNDVKFYLTSPFSDDISIIKDVKFGENVTMIDYGAFYGCTGLTSVIIPNNVTYISTNAFALCNGIKQAFFPASAQTQPSSFPGCPRAMYEVDADGNVVIESIGYSSRKAMVIPNVIEGVGTVVSVADTALWVYISPNGHDHFGGTATCQKLAQCAICGTEHGDLGEHTLVDGVCSVCGSIAINETNFPDANFRAYVSEEFDSDNDGYFKTSSRVLSVSDRDIADLKGIEFFTTMSTLYCSGNKLTSLDLSKNTNLTTLQCYSNQLTSLDLSKNTALTKLYCNNNQLTSLDLSKNTALTELHCNSNQLTSLDLSNNTELTRLLCNANSLSELDLSHNTNLEFCWCQENLLQELDLSNNTALTEINCSSNKLTSLNLNAALLTLNCSNNKLTSLDLSNCTALTMFKCNENQFQEIDLSKNTELISFWCTNNQIKELDLTKNTKLETLYCYANQIKELDLSKNTVLTTLDCRVNNLTSLDLSNTNVTSFSGSNNTYTVSSCIIDPADLPGEFDLSKTTNMTYQTLTDDNKILYLGTASAIQYHYDCGKDKSAFFTIYVSPHNCTKTEAQDATCTDDGNIEYYSCSVCGYKFGKAVPTKTDDIVTDEDIVTNATDHDYGSWTITEEPTLTETGEAERVCANDSTHKEKEFLPVLTDTSVWTKDEAQHIEPTEEDTGKDVYTSEYGEVEVTLPQKGHIHTLSKTEEKAAACTEDGNEAYWTCSGCHKMFSDENGTIEINAVPTISATGHTFAAEWSNNETNHWYAAICEHIDERRDEAAHTWDDGVVTTAPTETAEGEKTYTCTVCSFAKTESIAPLEHTHTLVWHPREVNFDEANGYGHENYWTCSSCSKMFYDQDGKQEINEIPKHNFPVKWTESPNGGHYKSCPTCGSTLNIAHSWDDGVITIQPTEEAEGEITYTCTDCFAEKTEDIPALTHTHTYSDEWSGNETNHWHAAACGHDVISEEAAHTEDNGTVTVPATYENAGVKTFACTVCSYVMRTETIPQLEAEHKHNFSPDWKHDNASHWHECDCGERSELADHISSVWIVEIPATADIEGVQIKVCTVCGTELDRGSIDRLPNGGTDKPSIPSVPPYTYPTWTYPVLPPTVTETEAKTGEEIIYDEPYIEDVSVNAAAYADSEDVYEKRNAAIPIIGSIAVCGIFVILLKRKILNK